MLTKKIKESEKLVKAKRIFHNRIFGLTVLTVLLVLSVIGVSSAVSPALALEEAPWCGMEEHLHTDACYINEVLVCGKRAHAHTVNCYPVQLADNDINSLLTKIDNTADKRLRSVISVTVREADRLSAQEEDEPPAPAEPEPVPQEAAPVTPEQIVRINATVARYGIQPSVVLNEALNTPSRSDDGIHEDELPSGISDGIATSNPSTGTLSLGDQPNTNDNYVNFYIRLDGKIAMIGSTKMQTVSSNDWSFDFVVSKSDIASLYQSVVETGLSDSNVQVTGGAYYLRYNTNGSTTQFGNAADVSTNNVTFGSKWGSSADPCYAILSYSRTTTSPVDFYTLTMDRSAVGEPAQTKYVEGGSYSYQLPDPGDGYHWEDEAHNTITKVSLTGPTTVSLKADSFTVRYLVDGAAYAEPAGILPGAMYTVAEPPEGWRCWRSQSGLLYYGGTEISINADLQLTAVRNVTVRFVYLNGEPDEQQVLQGEAVTLPAGRWKDKAGTTFTGGQSTTVNSDMTFTEVLPPPLTVSYNVNWSTPTQLQAPATAPSVVGATSVEVASGTSLTVSRVSSRVVSSLFTGFGPKNARSGAVYFVGWRAENGELLQPDTSVSYAELSAYDTNGDGKIVLTGVWDYNSLRSVNFFVKLNSSFSAGETTAVYYTPSIFATYLGGVPDGSNMTTLNGKYSIQYDSSTTTYLANDKKIRAMYGSTSVPWLAQMPSDQYIFEQLKKYVQGGGTLSVQNDAGEFETVSVNDLNENAYAIRWYLFKAVVDTVPNWHIDGVLVRKEGKVQTTKTFSGNPTLIERAKEGFYITAVNARESKRYIMTIAEPTDEERQRILAERGLTTEQITAWLTATGDGTGRHFLWEFGDVDYGETWTVTEYPPDLADLADYAEWVIIDASAMNQSSSGTGGSVSVTGVTQATDVENPEWLRVEFNNIYFYSNSLMLKKEDAATGRSLAGASFQFYQDGALMTFDFDAQTGLYIYNSSGGGAYSTLVCDGYTNISTSGFAYDRGEITVREVEAPEGYGLVGDITIGYLTETGGDIGLTSDVSFAKYDRGLLTVKNHAAQNEVTVIKHWNCQDAEREDIVVQLLANGSANDAADILKSTGQSATQTLTSVHGWTYTWHNLPDYANGVPVSWSVSELRIGSEQAKADGSFANWIVSYRTNTSSGTSLIIENTPKRPMLYLQKVDRVTGAHLRGAQFSLIAVDDNGNAAANAVEKIGVTDENGSLSFDNLRYNQRYRLIETIAPAGYFAYEDPAYFTLTEDGTVTVEAHEAVFSAGTAFHIRVTDPAGHNLPETGGAGAFRYSIAGAAALLAALSLALYLRKKREEGRKTT